MSNTETNHAKDLAKAIYENIVEMVAATQDEDVTGDQITAAQDTLRDSAYGLEVRSDWTSVGDKLTPGEFKIVLAGGGPAVRLVGDLDGYGQPYSAKLEYQDWGTSWTWYTWVEDATLIEYASNFYFGS